MKTLSLDPSLKASGWAIIDDKMGLLDCGCILTDNVKDQTVTNSDTQRLEYIANELKTIIKKWKPKKIIFENPVGSQSSRANQALSYLKGLVISAIVFSGIPYVAIKAKSVKMELTNDRNADKDTILLIVKKEYPNFEILTNKWTKVKTHAASDAVAVFLGYKSQEKTTV